METTLFLAQAPAAPEGAARIRRRLLEAGLQGAGIPPAQADRIVRSPDGKPQLSGHPAFHFNLSHSGDYIACIFSKAEIGLDLQEHRLRPDSALRCLRIARRYFTARECAALNALQAQEAQQDTRRESSAAGGVPSLAEAPAVNLFYRLWAIKEAYLKYIGCGLRGGMDGFCPLPLPAPMESASSIAFFSELAPGLRQSGSGKTKPPLSIRLDADDSTTGQLPARGEIEVLDGSVLFTSADYALLPAPAGYSIAVCAAELPDRICVRTL